MKRSGPLRRYKPLQGGAPLRAMSTKRQRENRERREMAEQRWPNGRPLCVVPWCGLLADDLHEPLTRARRGSIVSEDNTVPTCRGHNEELTREPAWGYELDLLVHSWDRRTPAQIAADRRRKLAAWPFPSREARAECGIHPAVDACPDCTACRQCGPCGCELAGEWAREVAS